MIVMLSEEQKELGKQQNKESDPEKRRDLTVKRNQKLTQLHAQVKEQEHQKIISQIKEIENVKDDSYRMFKAVRVIQTTNTKKPLVIETGEGLTANPQTQIEIISKHLQDMFLKDNTPELPNIPPEAMSEPFTPAEVEKAAKKLRNNKSAGIDELKPEQLKYGPKVIFQRITNIYNTMAQTGEYPAEVKQGILVPCRNQGKRRAQLKTCVPLFCSLFYGKSW